MFMAGGPKSDVEFHRSHKIKKILQNLTLSTG